MEPIRKVERAAAARPAPEGVAPKAPSRRVAGRTGRGAGVQPPGGMVRLFSGDYFGLDGRPVEVQVDVSDRGGPTFQVVGLAGKSIRESRERIRTAIRNSRFSFPHKDSIIVNLAPAAQQKDGAGFDLAIALGILLSVRAREGDGFERATLGTTGWLGELGLGGEVRPVPGALLVAHALKERGVREVFVAPGNVPEVALVDGLEALAVTTLRQAVEIALGSGEARAEAEAATGLATGLAMGPAESAEHSGQRWQRREVGELRGGATPEAEDFSDVVGQEATKRGLLVAAAGEHNGFLVGTPGVGKTMLVARLPGILPPLCYEEALEVTRIRSVLGQSVAGGLARVRPFRAPHHTISYAGLVGGGPHLRPGEVTRAHHGVLFLDELPEYQRRALETLREPLEEGWISLARSNGAVTYPCRFLLIAAMNPCPCGYLGHPQRPCSCTPRAVRAYLGRISGPLLDRFDLFLDVEPVDAAELLTRRPTRSGPSTGELHGQVLAARVRQTQRWGDGITNGRVSFRRLLRQGGFRSESLELVRSSAARLGVSARGCARMLRVARTIADLGMAAAVEKGHVLEALHYRQPPGH